MPNSLFEVAGFVTQFSLISLPVSNDTTTLPRASQWQFAHDLAPEALLSTGTIFYILAIDVFVILEERMRILGWKNVLRWPNLEFICLRFTSKRHLYYVMLFAHILRLLRLISRCHPLYIYIYFDFDLFSDTLIYLQSSVQSLLCPAMKNLILPATKTPVTTKEICRQCVKSAGVIGSSGSTVDNGEVMLFSGENFNLTAKYSSKRQQVSPSLYGALDLIFTTFFFFGKLSTEERCIMLLQQQFMVDVFS